jgi:lysophospholipase L1-like esterase
MAHDKLTAKAMKIGREQAAEVLVRRADARKRRAQALAKRPKKTRGRAAAAFGGAATTAGVLVAEGDSWFDYPFVDILRVLDDDYGFDVESVAHKGDPVEEMAYGGSQLDDFVRRLEKVHDRGHLPKAILVSGGGNDVAGAPFEMLLNHQRSAIGGLNASVLDGVIDQRVRLAFVTILSRVTGVCEAKFGRKLPILTHGYDYPVPDGRGFLGGLGLLPGPWLEPGFRRKGFGGAIETKAMAKELIERFNTMLSAVTRLPEFKHVSYIDLRGTLPTGAGYKDWWANELHPTPKGYRKVAEKFVKVLAALP